MIDRLARALFVVELVLLAAPTLYAFVASLSAFSEIIGVVANPEADGARGLGLIGLSAYALYGFSLSAFCVLAVRYLVGGGAGAARVTPIVWTIVLLGQAITLASVAWTAAFEFAPGSVRIVALLTFTALGLFIPLVHLIVAVLLARRGRIGTSPA